MLGVDLHDLDHALHLAILSKITGFFTLENTVRLQIDFKILGACWGGKRIEIL